ncbi:helix-turn-helix transcriptional regulator [Povalibacter sp.]|uniref:helix-turn-helix transcriptional regulator n=1 Tax=Povalibacter sp. TaxID=1962978 RepID=UPI002F40E3BC
MITNNEHLLTVTDAFHAAAFDRGGWHEALDGLAKATGSQSGELICIGDDMSVPINIVTDIDPGFHPAFIECGGGDPRVNPRVAAGMRAPLLKVVAESDFITPDECDRHPHYQEFARAWDVPYICLATLDRTPGMLVGLAALRNHRQGHITPQQREVFASIAPHVRAAVRTHEMLEDNGASIVAGAMEALSIPVFVCDRAGVVRAHSPEAESLLSAGRGLLMKEGRLHAQGLVENRALADAIAAAALGCTKPEVPMLRTVVMHSGRGTAPPLVLDVVALPRRDYEFSFAPRVLVVARGMRGTSGRRAAIVQAAYALTAAETDIAMQLTKGRTAEAIAASRNVATGTVRAQIKAVLAKIGVSRQIELVARLGEL